MIFRKLFKKLILWIYKDKIKVFINRQMISNIEIQNERFTEIKRFRLDKMVHELMNHVANNGFVKISEVKGFDYDGICYEAKVYCIKLWED